MDDSAIALLGIYRLTDIPVLKATSQIWDIHAQFQISGLMQPSVTPVRGSARRMSPLKN